MCGQNADRPRDLHQFCSLHVLCVQVARAARRCHGPDPTENSKHSRPGVQNWSGTRTMKKWPDDNFLNRWLFLYNRFCRSMLRSAKRTLKEEGERQRAQRWMKRRRRLYRRCVPLPAPKAPTCVYCGGIVKPDERHCPNCGAPHEQQEPAPRGPTMFESGECLVGDERIIDTHEIEPVFKEELLKWLRRRRRVYEGDVKREFNLWGIDEVRILELLENEGVVGPRRGSDGSREVRVGPRPAVQRGGR